MFCGFISCLFGGCFLLEDWFFCLSLRYSASPKTPSCSIELSLNHHNPTRNGFICTYRPSGVPLQNGTAYPQQKESHTKYIQLSYFDRSSSCSSHLLENPSRFKVAWKNSLLQRVPPMSRACMVSTTNE